MKLSCQNKKFNLEKKIIDKFDYLKKKFKKDEILILDVDYNTFYGFILLIFFKNNKDKLLSFFEDKNYFKDMNNNLLMEIIYSKIDLEELKNILEKLLFNDYKLLCETKLEKIASKYYVKIVEEKIYEIDSYSEDLDYVYNKETKQKVIKYVKKEESKKKLDKILLKKIKNDDCSDDSNFYQQLELENKLKYNELKDKIKLECENKYYSDYIEPVCNFEYNENNYFSFKQIAEGNTNGQQDYISVIENYKVFIKEI